MSAVTAYNTYYESDLGTAYAIDLKMVIYCILNNDGTLIVIVIVNLCVSIARII